MIEEALRVVKKRGHRQQRQQPEKQVQAPVNRRHQCEEYRVSRRRSRSGRAAAPSHPTELWLGPATDRVSSESQRCAKQIGAEQWHEQVAQIARSGGLLDLLVQLFVTLREQVAVMIEVRRAGAFESHPHRTEAQVGTDGIVERSVAEQEAMYRFMAAQQETVLSLRHKEQGEETGEPVEFGDYEKSIGADHQAREPQQVGNARRIGYDSDAASRCRALLYRFAIVGAQRLTSNSYILPRRSCLCPLRAHVQEKPCLDRELPDMLIICTRRNFIESVAC